jgi:hypothetical protein
MDIQIPNDSCHGNNCPAAFPVIGEPGGTVHIG